MITVEIKNVKLTNPYEVISGGDDSCPIWEEYVEDFKEEFRPHIAAIREKLESMGWVGKPAWEACNTSTFVFSDGTKIGFTWRAWGDLMQAIVGKREGYMKYY